MSKLLKILVLLFFSNFMFFSACLPFFDTGDTSQDPAIRSIINKWESLKPKYTGSPYDEEPNLSAPYSIGKLNDGFLKDGENMANFVRFLAGLPANIELDNALNVQAQHGAVLLAVSNFSHYPECPSDMEASFCSIAKDSTASSNLSWGITNLWGTIKEGYMRDDHISNLPKMGHRRWILNPPLEKVGFGYADERSAMQVFDKSGTYNNYDYIAWPSEGFFPKEFFDSTDPWTITLNPSIYIIPSIDDITITVTRQNDGSTWTLDASDNSPSEYGEYMNIDTGSYGIHNCIIFRPNVSDLQKTLSYDPDISGSKYNVLVEGLTNINDYSVVIEYTIEFFTLGAGARDAYNVYLSSAFSISSEPPRAINRTNELIVK